jgi:hypothetical protein
MTMTKMHGLIEAMRGSTGDTEQVKRMVADLLDAAKALDTHLGYGHGHSGALGRAYDQLTKASDAVMGACKGVRDAVGAIREAAGE